MAVEQDMGQVTQIVKNVLFNQLAVSGDSKQDGKQDEMDESK